MKNAALFNNPLKIAMATTAVVAFPGLLSAQEYVVQPGDTLMGIANSELGSPANWRRLCELNSGILDDCDRILPGMVLQLGDGPIRLATPQAAPDPEPEQDPVVASAPAEVLPEADVFEGNLMSRDVLGTAALGVLGQGGELPQGWHLRFWSNAEGVGEVIAISDDFIDLRITQATEGGVAALQFTPPERDFFPAEPNEDWRFSVNLAVIEGGLAEDGSYQLSGSERGEDGTPLRALQFLPRVSPFDGVSVLEGTASIENVDTQFINPDIRIRSQGPWEITLRIGAPTFGVVAQ